MKVNEYYVKEKMEERKMPQKGRPAGQFEAGGTPLMKY